MDQMDLFNYGMYDVVADMERMMTEIDLQLWQWQTDLDMMSFIGQDIPMRTYESVKSAQVDRLTVQRVPLTKGWGEREIIGVADVDLEAGVVRAEINDEYKELIGVPSAFSIRDEDPPRWDHNEIKAQLRNLVDPDLYVNPYTPLKVHDNGVWHDVMNLAQTEYSLKHLMPELEDHPFFRDNQKEK